MILAHKIELVPKESEIKYLSKCCGTARFVYNWGLDKWNTQYQEGQKTSALQLKKEFNSIKKKEYPWIYEVTKTAAEQPFSDLSNAFSKFFNGEAKHPVFKKKGKSRDSFYISNDKFRLDGKKVRIPKLGWVKMREELRFSGKINSAVVSRVADKWFISISVNTHDKYQPVKSQDSVGVDLGVSNLATLSNGQQFEGSKPLKKLSKKLRSLSKKLSRKEKGSKNRWKAKQKLARLHYRISCLRNDALHKLTHEITTNFKKIGIEDLNVQGMMKNRKLAKAIGDMGFYEFKRQLTYKSKLKFCEIGVVDRFFPSSQRCSRCGYKKEDLKLSERVYHCRKCDLKMNRDLNAAKNILVEAFKSS